MPGLAEFRELPRYGIGLTDIAKLTSRPDRGLRRENFDTTDLERRILAAAPRVIAFNGKKAAAAFLGRPTRAITVGRLPEQIEETELHVLPSTSGATAAFWKDEPWHALGASIRTRRA